MRAAARAFADIASDTLTTASGEHFTVEQYGGERFRFAVPKCFAGPQRLSISNWTFEDFKLFFDVTENSDLYLAKPSEKEGQEPCVHRRLQRRRAAPAPAVAQHPL